MFGAMGIGDYGEDGEGDDDFLLGGGPALEGVDYEGAWLHARAKAQALNKLFAGLGLDGDARVFAQAGWGDDGSGIVFFRGTLAGAQRLRELLERMWGPAE